MTLAIYMLALAVVLHGALNFARSWMWYRVRYQSTPMERSRMWA